MRWYSCVDISLHPVVLLTHTSTPLDLLSLDLTAWWRTLHPHLPCGVRSIFMNILSHDLRDLNYMLRCQQAATWQVGFQTSASACWIGWPRRRSIQQLLQPNEIDLISSLIFPKVMDESQSSLAETRGRYHMTAVYAFCAKFLLKRTLATRNSFPVKLAVTSEWSCVADIRQMQ